MLLAIDIGNTNITLGIFQGDQLRATWRLAPDVNRLADEYGVLMVNLLGHEGLSKEDLDAAVMCSVVPDLEPVFEQVCRRYFDVTPLVVGAGVRTGLRILYDSPRDVGADRVADAVAAIPEGERELVGLGLGRDIDFGGGWSG